MSFDDLKLIAPILKALKTQGYTVPTLIQEQAIPPLLEGRDLIGCAQTGTGKTAAFAVPILQLLAAELRNPKAPKTIKALIEGDRSQPEAYDRLYALIDRLDGFNAAARTAGQLVDAAIDALALFSAPGPEQENVALLKELARYILARQK